VKANYAFNATPEQALRSNRAILPARVNAAVALMNDLIARFDASVPDQWEPHALPTADSLAAVEARFAFRVPSLLIEFARKSKSFSSFFLSLGPDLDNHSHIITKNEMVRTHDDWLRWRHGTPALQHLVFFTENFMEDFFWSFDTSHPGPEFPIVIWRPNEPAKRCYADFTSFVLAQIEHYRSK